MAGFRGENVYPTNIKTTRIAHVITTADVSAGVASVDWTLSPPFPDSNYTVVYSVEATTSADQSFVGALVKSGNTVTALPGVSDTGNTITLNFVAIHDFGLLP